MTFEFQKTEILFDHHKHKDLRQMFQPAQRKIKIEKFIFVRFNIPIFCYKSLDVKWIEVLPMMS